MKCLFIYNPLSGKNKKLMKKMDYIQKIQVYFLFIDKFHIILTI